jgi:hypothetical protein
MKSLLYAFMLAIVSFQEAPAAKKTGDAVVETPIVRLIAHPEKFQGKRVLIKGYCRIEFEHSAIYLSEGDAKISNYA